MQGVGRGGVRLSDFCGKKEAVLVIEWLIRLGVKEPEKVSSPAVREQYGRLAGMVGVGSNVVLFLIKFAAGVLFSSISVMADAVNNLSDAGSSVITLVGFKLSGKPADAEHPYGHARMEYITGLVVSFLIILIGLQLVRSSVEKIFHPDPIHFSWLTVGVLAVSIFIKLWQSRSNRTIGRRIQSTTLEATATDSMGDVLSTSAVLLSTLAAKVTGLQLDGWMGAAVAVFITVSGIRLVGETIDPLLGKAPTPELVKELSDKIMGYEGVIGLHDLVVHNYGPGRCFASVHVEVPAKQDILVSHDIIDNIEHDIQGEMGIHLVIHLDPIVTDDPLTTQRYRETKALVKEISPLLSIHDFRLVVGKTHTNILFDVLVPADYPESDQEVSHQVCAVLKERYPEDYPVITVDRNYTSTIVEG